MPRYKDGSRHRALQMTPEERFWSRVEKSEGCWRWMGAHDRRGYGRYDVTLGGQQLSYAHRVAFLLVRGVLPGPGLELDHICRNPDCINPAHLEPVTHRENVRRGLRAQPRLSEEEREASRLRALERARSPERKAYKAAWYHANKERTRPQRLAAKRRYRMRRAGVAT